MIVCWPLRPPLGGSLFALWLGATSAEIRFRSGGVYVLSVTLALIVLLTLIVWRLVFASLQRRPFMREMAVPQRRNNNLLDLEAALAIAGNRFVNNSHAVDRFERRNRTITYLRRIVALTGATQTSQGYVLAVGTTRFCVRDGYVERQRDASDPKCGCERTCFSLPYNSMSQAEQIATALLQLRNNPALFDRWAAQCGAYKADGQVFTRAQ